MIKTFESRCERYIRDSASFIGWAHYDGFGIIRTDAVRRNPPRLAFESEETYATRCAKVKPLKLTEQELRAVNRLVKKLERSKILVRYVEYTPKTGLQEVRYD